MENIAGKPLNQLVGNMANSSEEPTSTCSTETEENATQGHSDVDCSLKAIQRSGVKHGEGTSFRIRTYVGWNHGAN